MILGFHKIICPSSKSIENQMAERRSQTRKGSLMTRPVAIQVVCMPVNNLLTFLNQIPLRKPSLSKGFDGVLCCGDGLDTDVICRKRNILNEEISRCP